MPNPIDKFADSIAESAPEPTESIPEEPRSSTHSLYTELRDALGNAFSPDEHVTDDDGKPILTRAGRLKRKPGRKGGATGQRSSLRVPGGIPATPDAAADLQSSRAVAVATVASIQSLGMMIGGDEWKMKKDESTGLDEFAHGVEAFTNYYDASGIRDIPPGLGIAIFGISYAVPRFFQPKTKSRVKLAYEWAKVKIFRGKRNAQSNSRDDRKRENDTRDSSSREIASERLRDSGSRPTARQ